MQTRGSFGLGQSSRVPTDKIGGAGGVGSSAAAAGAAPARRSLTGTSSQGCRQSACAAAPTRRSGWAWRGRAGSPCRPAAPGFAAPCRRGCGAGQLRQGGWGAGNSVRVRTSTRTSGGMRRQLWQQQTRQQPGVASGNRAMHADCRSPPDPCLLHSPSSTARTVISGVSGAS